MITLLASGRRVETRAALALGAAALVLSPPLLRDLPAAWLYGTYYSYGFLVPLFSAYLAWDAWRRYRNDVGLEIDSAPSDADAATGVVITAAGVAILGIGVAAGSLTLGALSVPVVLMGLAVATLPAPLPRRMVFPIGFLVFMAPLPEDAVPAVSLPLQRLAAFVAEHALRVLGVTVMRDDLSLALPSVTLHVTEACNGLRFLLALLVVATAFAGTMPGGPLRRGSLVLAALTAATIANLARVTGTGVMAELWGAHAAQGLPHIVWGKIVYALALIPFAGLVAFLRRR